jgi:hypothetical protein
MGMGINETGQHVHSFSVDFVVAGGRAGTGVDWQAWVADRADLYDSVLLNHNIHWANGRSTCAINHRSTADHQALVWTLLDIVPLAGFGH